MVNVDETEPPAGGVTDEGLKVAPHGSLVSIETELLNQLREVTVTVGVGESPG
jgi:hypothetical protein